MDTTDRRLIFTRHKASLPTLNSTTGPFGNDKGI